ncbi:MAG TPA: HEAT repeat domain-containing protein [Fimbriiglobus sp.]|jgi:hypothetical protein|nr:HEAT repeat domain-containing protein [Fimbriiglobus sp.]
MKRITVGLRALLLVSAGLFLLPSTVWAQPPPSPLEKYRRLEFPPKAENFSKGWKDRVALEFEIINSADLKSLRSALKDEDPFVRAMAAHALGILGDKASADALAELVKADPEQMVRMRAVGALGFLKMKAEVIELAQKDRDAGVCWEAKLAAGQLKSDTDHAALVRRGYAGGIKREAMGTAKVGQPAPDFTAHTTDGTPFKLSTVLGKKPIALYFAAFDG